LLLQSPREMAAGHDEGIGRAIRRRREALGLSQRGLARRAGVSQPYLSQLEAATRGRISLDVLRRVADALDVPVPLAHFGDHEPSGVSRRGRTEVWLYRMTGWHLAREVREGHLLPRPWDLSVATIDRRGGRLPQPGDIIALCLVASGIDAGGLCGLGVVTELGGRRQLRLRALPPTETLEATPRCSAIVRRLVAAIPATTAGVMWRIPETDVLAG